MNTKLRSEGQISCLQAHKPQIENKRADMLSTGFEFEMEINSKCHNFDEFGAECRSVVSSEHGAMGRVEEKDPPLWIKQWKARTMEWFYLDKLCDDLVEFARKS